jgi:hypothetical protein
MPALPVPADPSYDAEAASLLTQRVLEFLTGA